MRSRFPLLVAILLAVSACMEKNEEPDLTEKVTGTFRAHSSLQDNMVVQQNGTFVAWGKSRPGVRVNCNVTWSDRTFTCITGEDNIWRLEVPTPSAEDAGCGPRVHRKKAHTVKLWNSMSTITFENIYIGDVWAACGQSNMTFQVILSDGAAEDIAAADYPYICMYNVYLRDSKDEVYDWDNASNFKSQHCHVWEPVTPVCAPYESAVAFYFARKLFNETGIPIGIVNMARGGAAAQSLVSEDFFERHPSLKDRYYTPYLNNESVLARPCEIYNSMVHPLENMAFKGFIWYQGEGNCDSFDMYDILMDEIIDEYRETFTCGKHAPFYFVQIAPWAFGISNYEDPVMFYLQEPLISYAFLREKQAQTREDMPHTGMVVTMDVGQPEDIHFTNKKPVGERLARIALNKDYGMSDVRYLGPQYKSHSVENGTVKVRFANAEGLRTNDGKEAQYFYLSLASDSSHIFHKGKTSIHGEEVWITCPDIVGSTTKAEDIIIRYAFLTYPVTNLENGEGLPAEPFRTDSWPYGTSVSYSY